MIKENKMPDENKVETLELPKIAKRAIAMVNAEMQRTVMEAAELVGADLQDGWKLSQDGMSFTRMKK